MKITNLMKLNAALAQAAPRLLPSLRVLRASVDRRVDGASVDVVIDAATPTGRRQRLLLDVRAAESPGRVRDSARRLKAALSKSANAYPMIASNFLSPRVRQICREEGVGYLDLAGNCWLQTADCYVEKTVETNPHPPRGRPSSLFTPIASRILRAMLEEPKRTWQVSEVSREARVSLGHASGVCRRLIDDAYAERSHRRLRLREPGHLLDAWREAHAPAHHAARPYYSFEREPHRLMKRLAGVGRRRRLRYALTSFGAASLVAPFVRGVGLLQWYIEEGAADAWVAALDLRPAEAGANAILLAPRDEGVWYRARAVEGVTVVGSIQLYLDLSVESGRAREQAEFLRTKMLRF